MQADMAEIRSASARHWCIVVCSFMATSCYVKHGEVLESLLNLGGPFLFAGCGEGDLVDDMAEDASQTLAIGMAVALRSLHVPVSQILIAQPSDSCHQTRPAHLTMNCSEEMLEESIQRAAKAGLCLASSELRACRMHW